MTENTPKLEYLAADETVTDIPPRPYLRHTVNTLGTGEPWLWEPIGGADDGQAGIYWRVRAG